MIARRRTEPAKRSTASRFDANRNVEGFERFSWDNLRLFLAVADAGSFRSAAGLAGVSINTIRTKVDRLERQIGGPLFRRSVEGVALTQDGRELLEIAREMRNLGTTTARVAARARSRGNEVRLAVSEGIGTFWLIPRLGGLQAARPDLRVAIDCGLHAMDALFRDVDIALQLRPPADPELIVEQVATLHLVPFASEAYIARHGTPKSIADATGHRLIWLKGDAEGDKEAAVYLEAEAREKIVAVEVNTYAALYGAVASGAGIGFLPSYVRYLDPNLRALDVGVVVPRPLYLVHREDALDDGDVAAARAWLAEAFDPATYPAFGREFVHPDAFALPAEGAPQPMHTRPR